MLMRNVTVALLSLAVSAGAATAQNFEIVRVASVSGAAVGQLKTHTILFNDQRTDEKTDAGAFMRFNEWAQSKPLQKQYLALFPGFTEGTIQRVVDGFKKEVKDELQVYVTEARFILSKPASAVDLKKFATLSFIQSMDPQIKHEVIRPADVSVLDNERSSANRHPGRNWCEGAGVAACTRSKYKLEGKLPMGVALANKLREGERKLSDTIEFESEMRLLTGTDVDEASVKKLTGIETPVAGVLEQSMFHVNQVIRFGKLLAVFQPNPADEKSTVATVMISLAVSSNTLESQKKYQNVPVLRNLVPSQVLLGNSSFNTGNSISSGLPNYVRNRIKAIAEIMERG